jgi:tricarballylate dehydrogenase
MLTQCCDVMVIGGGNAALCAAISARRAGAQVCIIEHAPRTERGGNSKHTRNLRLSHAAPTEVLSESYPEDEYLEDLLKVTEGNTNIDLARLVIGESPRLAKWMQAQGMHFQKSLSGTLNLERTNAFFLGGGKALVNAYYATAEDLGITIRYGTEAMAINLENGRCVSVELHSSEGVQTIACKAVVVASGGFQANEAWMRSAWGEAADNFLIRGTPYNRGRLLADLRDKGCALVGDETQGHMVAIDGRAPKFDGGIATRLDCIPFSVVVNQQGNRFYDEGEDFWPKRYAIWGRLVAAQPQQVAYAVIDAKSINLFMPSVFDAYTANTLDHLAQQMGLDGAALTNTIDAYNRACQSGQFDPDSLDGLSTRELAVNKTNWARPIDKPPYYGYVLRPGVTFTYLGLKVNEHAKVLFKDDTPSANIYAAGEIMAGNILGQGYLAGLGMTIGTVFGRIAGVEAAKHV